jgi:hypothetical protein
MAKVIFTRTIACLLLSGLGFSSIAASITYTWNVSSGDLSTASNWSPNRNSPQSDDILVFQTTSSANLNSATINAGQIIIQNAANVTWIVTNNTAGGVNINIGAGIAGDDFTIGSASTLNLSEGANDRYAKINVLTNNTAAINGKLVINGGSTGESKLIGFNSSAITVGSAGIIEVASGLRGYPFYNGSDNTTNVVIFSSGSQYIHNSVNALNPFALNGSSKVVFTTGSTFIIRNGTNTTNPSNNGEAYKGTFDVTGRTYANIIVESSVSIRFQNADWAFNNLTIKTGVSFSVATYDPYNNGAYNTSKITIKGDITGEGTGSLFLQTGQSSDQIRFQFNSGGNQTIGGGTGDFYFDTNTYGYFDIANGTTLTLGRNILFGNQSTSTDRRFRINSGAIFVMNDYCVTAKGDALLINSGYVKTTNQYGFYRAATNSAVSFSGFKGDQGGQPGFTTSGTVEYNRAGDQEVTLFGNGYYNLTLSGSGTKTANLISNAYIVLKNAVNIASGVVYNQLAYSLDYSAATLNVYGTFKTTNLLGFTRSDVNGNYLTAVNAINLSNLNLASGSVIDYAATTGTQKITPLTTYKGLKVSGGSTKELYPFENSSLLACVVSENLILENGIINITPFFANTPTFTLDVNAVVTGGSSSSYVNNVMYRKTNTAASFVFPVGKTTGSYPYTSYRPFTITTTETTATTFSGEYFPMANANIAQPLLGSILAVLNKEYWQANRTAGNAKAKVALPYINPNAASGWTPGLDPASGNCYVVVVKYNSSAWEYTTSQPSTFTASEARLWNDNGYISTKEISSFSPFTFGFVFPIILPVKLLSFEASIGNKGAQLNWEVADKKDLAGFELEYSTDGTRFSLLATINNDSQKSSYSYTHAKLGTENYYRLKIIEKSGKWYYSKTILLTSISPKTIVRRLRPTVVNEEAWVDLYSAKEQQAILRVYDIAGRLIWQQKKQLLAGENTLSVQTKLAVKGTYSLTIQTDDGAGASLRFIKK